MLLIARLGHWAISRRLHVYDPQSRAKGRQFILKGEAEPILAERGHQSLTERKTNSIAADADADQCKRENVAAPF
jgi:hypothetical protein